MDILNCRDFIDICIYLYVDTKMYVYWCCGLSKNIFFQEAIIFLNVTEIRISMVWSLSNIRRVHIPICMSYFPHFPDRNFLNIYSCLIHILIHLKNHRGIGILKELSSYGLSQISFSNLVVMKFLKFSSSCHFIKSWCLVAFTLQFLFFRLLSESFWYLKFIISLVSCC